ncbi:MAG TPA: type VI secretion system baseplate subunit TssF, partial [Chthoniobacteraceae bacterium]
MNRSFLKLYNNELHHLRHMAAEFAREFPKIAGRLALDSEAKDACPDPFVERLLEGVAFLTARVQLKLDAEFPQFTQSILETVYPHYLCPTPSMAVVRLEPDRKDPGPPDGFVVPRGSAMRGASNDGDTPSEFRTAHDVRLWPLEIAEARYFTRDLAQLELPHGLQARAAIRIHLRTTGGAKFKGLHLDRLPIHVRGLDEIPVSIFEQIFCKCSQVVVKMPKSVGNLCQTLPPESIHRVGLSENEALLPYAPRGFEGHRLLQEYFALPQRFLFFELTGLRPILELCDCDQIDLIIVLREAQPQLENRIEASSFDLF